MSVSKWKWTPECDKGICVGDCDECDKAVKEVTIKAKFYKQMPDPFVNLKKIEVHDPSIDQLVEERKAQAEPEFGEWVPIKTRLLVGQPTADVVEVVRCENCWFYESLNSACGNCHSERWGNGFGNYPPPVVGIDGFCKWGERKEKWAEILMQSILTNE
jgi:hypothetical protein